MKALPAALAAAAFTLFFAAPAGAHAIHLFAYHEGGQICANAHESDEERVPGAQVSMLGPGGDVLAQGVTDGHGDVCFPQPAEKGDLLFTVEAEGGHRAEFKLAAGQGEGRQAAEAQSERASRVTARDVVGGLGWIVGFAGAYLWLKSRRRGA